MLRGFGANKVLEVGQTGGLLQTLSAQKIDILLCDARLPPYGGLVLTRTIRRNADNVNRTMPILLMSSDTREVAIKSARDAGANMRVSALQGSIATLPNPATHCPHERRPSRGTV